MRLPWTAWEKTLRRLGLRLIKKSQPEHKSRHPHLEQLESRELLATVSIEKVLDANEEGSQAARFRIYRDTTSGASSITYNVSGTAIPSGQQNSDHDRYMGQLSLNQGQSEIFFDVTPVNDQLSESTETIIVTISPYSIPSPPPQIGTSQAQASLFDNDGLPSVTVSALDASAAEQGQDAGVFRITRSASSSSSLTVNYTLSGSATNGSDFQSLTGSATIPGSATYVDVSVVPIDDQNIESSETAVLTVSSSSAYTVGSSSSATVNIADNDTLPVVTVSALDASAAEQGQDAGVFRITRSASSSSSLTVNYTLSGSATNGSDFQSLTGSATIPGSATYVDVSVVPIDDQNIESTETAVLTVSSSSAYTVGSSSSATVNIADNDTLPVVTVSADDASAAEQGPDIGVFRITRSAASSSTLAVNYTLSGTAVNGTDYQTLSGTATIGSGQTYVDVTLGPIDDQILEMTGETAILMLSTSSLYMIGSSSSATVNISDNDMMTMSIVTVTQTQDARERGASGYVRLTRSGNFYQELAVHFAIDASSQATVGQDFAYLSGSSAASPNTGTVTFGAGSSVVDIAVAALPDSLVEGSESLRIQLISSSTYTIGGSAAQTLWILDDTSAAAPAVTIGKRVSEVQKVVLPDATGGTWTMSVGSQTTAPLAYGASAIALQGTLESLSNIGVGNVTAIGSGTMSDPYQVTFRGTLRYTDMPQVSVDLSGLTGIAAPTAQVSTTSSGIDGHNQVFEVAVRSLNSMSPLNTASGSLRFSWGDPGIGAYPASETPRQSSSVSWTATTTALKNAIEQIPNLVSAGGTVSVTLVESTSLLRRFRVEFTDRLGNRPVSNLTAINDVTGTAVQDMSGGQAVVETSTITQGERGTGNEVQLLTLSNVQGGSFTLAGWGETTAAIPYNAEAATVESALKALNRIGDQDVSVSGPAGGPWSISFQGELGGQNIAPLVPGASNLWGSQAIIETIADGGSVQDWGQNTAEGSSPGYFRVYREGPTTGDLPVYFSLDTGTTAQAGTDFETLPASVTIPAGQAMADIFVGAIDDTSVESTEYVRLKLILPPTDVSGVIEYTLGNPSTGSVSIGDNDVMGPLYGVSISATQSATEGAGAGYFRVSRTTPTSSPVTVTYQVGGSSTASSNDYAALTGSVTIPAGAASADVAVQAVDDLVVEGTEQLQVTLVGVSSYDYSIGNPASGAVSILDNDQPPPLPVIEVVETRDTTEGSAAGWFRLSRSGSITSTLIVKYAIDTFYSTADNGLDTAYLPGTSAGSPSQGTITFAAGSATADISVVSIDDRVIEGTEGLRISVVENSPATYSLGQVTVGSLSIRDNDEVMTGSQVTPFGLLNDTGNSATDRVTYDPRLHGVVAVPANANEVQHVYLAGPPTGGTFTLSFEGQTTGNIAWNAAAATVKTALEALSNIGAGQVVVSGAASDYTVTFQGALAATNVSQMTGSGTNLTGGATTSVQTITQGQAGQNEKWTLTNAAGDLLYFRFKDSFSGLYSGWIGGGPGIYASQIQGQLAEWFAGGSYRYGPGNISVAGNAGGPWTIEWIGALANTDIADDVTIDSAAFGSGGTLTYTKVQDGNNTLINEVENLTILNGPTGGTFAISFRGSTTAGIPFNAPAATVQSAFTGLATVGAGQCVVTGNAGGPYTFTFQGALAGINVEQVTASQASLTGSTVAISTTTQGVTGPNGTDTFRIDFDHNGDGQADGNVSVTSNGAAFTYDPRISDSGFANQIGARTVSYRVVHLAANGTVLSTSPWEVFSFELQTDPSSGAIRMEGLRLQRDTGENTTDRVTVNPTLVGKVLGDFTGGTVRIDFDHAGNGTVDGHVNIAQSVTSFSYDPRVSQPSLETFVGALLIRYRLVRIAAGGGETVGGWADFNLTLEKAPSSQLKVQGLHLWADNNGDFSSGRTLVAGQVVGPAPTGTDPSQTGASDPSGAANPGLPPGAFVSVEIDLDGDGAADKEVVTGEDSRFIFDPTLLGYGEHTIRARATEWRQEYAMDLKGEWATFTFTLVPPPGPAIGAVSLVNDTGESDTDRVTSDPTVQGNLADSAASKSYVNIEFDWTGDGTVDGDTWTDELGNFEFTPHNLAAGAVTLRSRGTRWDSILNQEVSGAWSSFQFTYSPLASSSVSTLTLLEDTGSSSTDGVTYVSTLVGELAGGDELAGIDVQFDHNGDSQIDGFTTSDEEGAFQYEPVGLAVGQRTVRARTKEWVDNSQSFVYSAWKILPFTLENSPNAAVSVSSLELLEDTGSSATDLITTNPALVGELANDSSVAQVTVEFDHNGDGVVDGKTTSSDQGSFAYLPRGLAVGQRTVRARAIEWDPRTQQNIVGGWTTISFQLAAIVNTAPVVQPLTLVSDSGSSATDHVTANPTVSGQVANDGSVAGLGVELDFNGDNAPDGSTLTDENGAFQFEPKGLALGTISARARGVEWDASQNAYLRGAWSTPLAFTLEAQANQPARLVELALGDPLPDSKPLGNSFLGRITNEGSVAGVAVEFDYNNDGQVDQSIQTDRAGRFAMQPRGLSAGPISIHVRTSESDPVSHAPLHSTWGSYSFTYAVLTPALPQVDSLVLTNDTGTSATDKVTTDSSLKGSVSVAAESGFVTVQFDHNGDGVVDGDAVAGSDLQFTYQPVGLTTGAQSVRARTKNYDQNSAVAYGTWFILPFTLEAAASSPAVTSLVLAHDTGNSNSDGSTSDASLSGNVAGIPSSTLVKIEFDHDGDGIADGNTTRYGNGAFSYQPQGLSTGLNTVFARAVPPSGSNLATSNWVSVSFVNSSSPDGTEAQALVPLVASLNGASGSAQSSYQGSLASAANSHRSASQAADAQYDTSVNGAVSTRNQSVGTAESNYQNAINSADAAYAAALATAASTLQSNLAAFNGDTTSYDFQPFAWPQAPQRNALQIPDDSTLPQPLVEPPTYTGPQVEYAAYQAGVDATYNNSVASADETRRSAFETAKTAYDDAVKVANEKYRQDLKTAEDTYRNSLDATSPVDLKAERQAHNDRVQTAYDARKTALDGAAATYKSAMQQAASSLTQSINSANQSYSNSIQGPYQTYMQALTNPTLSPADRRNAYIQYEQAVFNAAKTRDGAIANARHQYDSSAAAAITQKTKADSAAYKTCSDAVAASQATLDKKVADDRHWQQTNQINARETFEHAKVEASRLRARSIADAQRQRDQAEALAEKQHTISVGTATVTRWQAEVAARQAQVQAWNAAQQTPWSAYQLALVNNEAQYISQKSTAYTQRTALVADADYIETVARAEATKVRSYAKAEADAIHDNAVVTAKGAYWRAPANAAKTRSYAMADARKQESVDYAAASKTRTDSGADASSTHNLKVSDAYFQYDTDSINARQFEVSSNPNDVKYWGVEYVDGAALVNFAGSRDKSLAQTNHDYAIAGLDLSKAYQTAIADANLAYQNADSQARKAEEDALSNALETYQKAVALADKVRAVKIVEDDGVQKNSVATAHVAFVSSNSNAEKTYSVADAQGIAGNANADALSEQTYRTNEAGLYVSIMTSWSTAENSRWSQLHLGQAQAELIWANAIGAANVTFVSATAASNLTQATAAANADQAFANSEATLAQTQAGSLVTASNTYAVAMGQAKLDYAYALAKYLKEQEQSRDNSRKAHADAANLFEHDQSKKDYATEDANQRALVDAMLPFRNLAIDAAKAFALSDHSSGAQATYNQAMDSATSTYNTAAHAAWDTLRLARADSMYDRQVFYATSAEGLRLGTRDDGILYVDGSDLTTAARNLADVTKTQTIALATAGANANKTYAAGIANAELTRTNSQITADATSQYATKLAEENQQLAQNAADSGKRENLAAVRGLYVVALHADHAANLQAAALSDPSPLATFQAATAIADAAWADTDRIANDLYQDAFSYASYNFALAAGNADLALASTVLTAQAAEQSASATAQKDFAIASANADYNLTLSNVTAEATKTRSELDARIAYDTAYANALGDLAQALATANVDYATAAADAWRDLYLANTDDWTDITTPPASYNYGSGQTVYSGGSWGMLGWGWSGSTGFGLGIGGGYVYGIWNDYYLSWGGLYGLGWNGWGWGGLGWNWGYGYGYGGYGWGWGGWNPQGDDQAWQDYQDALQTASDARTAAIDPAQLTYVTAIGDAQITRATSLGDYGITLATARGNAGVAYNTANNQAEAARSSANASASATLNSVTGPANTNLAISMAVAEQTRVYAEGSAEIALRVAEGNTAMVGAGFMATAEADLAIALAQQQSNSFSSQTGYGFLNADAYHDWLVDDKADYVTHAVALATADAAQMVSVAQAAAGQNVSRTAANSIHDLAEAAAAAVRGATVLSAEQTQDNSMRGLVAARNISHATATKTYEIAVATSEKDYAIDVATADKEYHRGRVQHQSLTTLGNTRKETIADAQLDRGTSQADAVLNWKKADSAARKNYSIGAAAADFVFSNSQSSAEWVEAGDVALAEATLDSDFALSDRSFSNAQTVASNVHRASAAQAEVTFWSAEYGDQITAVQSIDAALQSPWSQFLVDRALAEQAWRQSLNTDYLAWKQNESQATTTHENAFATANASHQISLNIVRLDQNGIDSLAQRDNAQAEAVATRDYAFTLLGSSQIGPAEKYVNDVAQAERDYVVAKAQAGHDYTLNNNYSAYQTALTNADTARKNATRAAEQAYNVAKGNAEGAQFVAKANAEYQEKVAEITAEQTKALAEAVADRVYEVTRATIYATWHDAQSALDAGYQTQEASSHSSSLATLNTNYPSPWAQYEQSNAAARSTQVSSKSSATHTLDDAYTDSDRDVEIATVQAEEAYFDAWANLAAAYDAALANSNLALAQLQSTMISALGQGGISLDGFPDLVQVPSIPSYSIPAASDSRYYVDVSYGYGWGWGWPFGWGLGWYGGYYGGFGYGGLSYGGLGYYGGGIFGMGYGLGSYGFGMDWNLSPGYFGGDGFSYGGLGAWNVGFGGLFGDPSLSEPQPPLPLESGYWDLAGQANKILHPDTASLSRFVIDKAKYGLSIEGTAPALSGSTTSAPPSSSSTSPGRYFVNALGGSNNAQNQGQGGNTNPVSAPVRDRSKNWTKEEVNEILDNIDPELGAYWKKYGSVGRGALQNTTPPKMGNVLTMRSSLAVPDAWTSRQVAWEISRRARTAPTTKTFLGVPGWENLGLAPDKPDSFFLAFHAYLSIEFSPTTLTLEQRFHKNAGDANIEDRAIYTMRGVPIGRRDGRGWVYLDIGGRATERALGGIDPAIINKVHPDGSIAGTNKRIDDYVAGTRSPFQLWETSPSIGIFIDGTGNHLESLTNISRLYNAYAGTKFYYGGVGNLLDWPDKGTLLVPTPAVPIPLANGVIPSFPVKVPKHPVEFVESKLGNGLGYGWKEILRRVVHDIMTTIGPSTKIDIFGFSRGAAQANELARYLGKNGRHVRFLGMYDPVYSYVAPGQGSHLTTASTQGLQSNYVESDIPQTVRNTVVYYAAHETRSFIQATKFAAGHNVHFIRAPGGHGDVGAHWQDNPFISSLTLHGMAKYARDADVPILLGSQEVDQEIVAYFRSPHVVSIANSYAIKGTPWDLAAFEKRQKPPYWAIIDEQTYSARVASEVESDWEPGLRGVQYGYYNVARWLPEVEEGVRHLASPIPKALRGEGFSKTLVGPNEQPWQDFYPRIMPWVTEDLYDLYGDSPTKLYEKMAKWRINDVHYKGEKQYGNGWDPASKE